jgi:mercuric ion transport protein
MPKAGGRATTRWGLSAIGLGVVACVGCCALPVLAAGGIVGGGLALMHDSCLAPLAILLLVVGLAALALWIRRSRRKAKCGGEADCGCASESEPKTLQANTFRAGS